MATEDIPPVEVSVPKAAQSTLAGLMLRNGVLATLIPVGIFGMLYRMVDSNTTERAALVAAFLAYPLWGLRCVLRRDAGVGYRVSPIPGVAGSFPMLIAAIAGHTTYWTATTFAAVTITWYTLNGFSPWIPKGELLDVHYPKNAGERWVLLLIGIATLFGPSLVAPYLIHLLMPY